MRIIPTAARLWWLPYALGVAVGCAHESDAAVRLRDALDAEGNRLRLLAEASGAVEMAASREPYWVALVPENDEASLGPSLPFTPSEYARACPSEPLGARIVVGDRHGIDCVISTALHLDAVQVVSKNDGESVKIDLFCATDGVRVVALH